MHIETIGRHFHYLLFFFGEAAEFLGMTGAAGGTAYNFHPGQLRVRAHDYSFMFYFLHFLSFSQLAEYLRPPYSRSLPSAIPTAILALKNKGTLFRSSDTYISIS